MAARVPGPAELEVVEGIAAKDRSSLYLSAQFLADPERYRAFVAMYAVMRLIDDAVDEVEDKQRLPTTERAALHALLDRWGSRVHAAYRGAPEEDAVDRALSWALQRFPVPRRLWADFLAAMHYDVDHPRFDDFDAFRAYAEGAAVAPTAIYIYLLTAEAGPDGVFRVHGFDYRRCGRDLGLFAYVAHILRDVRADALAGSDGLVYLSQADLAAHQLTPGDLRRFAERGAGDPRFAGVVRDLVARARACEQHGAALADSVGPALPPDRRFVLRLIIAYYQALLARVADPAVDLFGCGELLDERAKLRLLAAVAAEAAFEIPREALARAARAGSRVV